MAKRIHNVIYVLLILLAIALIGGGGAITAASRETVEYRVPGSFNALAQKARPGVVNIQTVKTVNGGGQVYRHFFGNPFNERNPFRGFPDPFNRRQPDREFKQRSLGSGFIIDTQGYIVTNNHVIDKADQIKVKLSDGETFDAEVVGRDSSTDLALLKIPASDDLHPLPLGNSKNLKVGTWVVAIGSPFGLEQTVTAGIVSAKGRVIGAGPYDDFIQTDASINPGNSGGPLLNMDGEVVGINTAITRSGQGIGFAIPANLAKGIIEQLKSGGEVSRGWLGVGIQDLNEELAEYYNVKNAKGVLVAQVFEDDPADKAGIKAGDVIIAIDGKDVSSSRELTRLIADTPVGHKTKVTVLREGEKRDIAVTLAERPNGDKKDRLARLPSDNLGLRLKQLSPETANRYGLAQDETGLLVLQVKPGSKGDRAGLEQGDVIKEINRMPIDQVTEFKEQLDNIAEGETVQLLVKRKGSGYVAVRFEK